MKSKIIVYIGAAILVITGWMLFLSGCNAVNIEPDAIGQAKDIQAELAIAAIKTRDGTVTRADGAALMERAADWFDAVANMSGVSTAFKNEATAHAQIFRKHAEFIRDGKSNPAQGAEAMESAVRVIDLFRRADAGVDSGRGADH